MIVLARASLGDVLWIGLPACSLVLLAQPDGFKLASLLIALFVLLSVLLGLMLWRQLQLVLLKRRRPSEYRRYQAMSLQQKIDYLT